MCVVCVWCVLCVCFWNFIKCWSTCPTRFALPKTFSTLFTPRFMWHLPFRYICIFCWSLSLYLYIASYMADVVAVIAMRQLSAAHSTAAASSHYDALMMMMMINGGAHTFNMIFMKEFALKLFIVFIYCKRASRNGQNGKNNTHTHTHSCNLMEICCVGVTLYKLHRRRRQQLLLATCHAASCQFYIVYRQRFYTHRNTQSEGDFENVLGNTHRQTESKWNVAFLVK